MNNSQINKNYYITLLSSKDYLPGVLILNQSLKNVKSKYQLLVAVTDNICEEMIPYLQKENLKYEIIPYLPANEGIVERFPNDLFLINTASKINIFSLRQYDKLVFIDADSIILKNIDELFNYPDGTMYKDVNPAEAGMSCLFVFCPSNHRVDFYQTLIKNLPILDGDLLGQLWFYVSQDKNYQIPSNYFLNITCTPFNIIPLYQLKGLHFCYFNKPWQYKTASDFLKDFHKHFAMSLERIKLINLYFDDYLLPLRKKYPELN